MYTQRTDQSSVEVLDPETRLKVITNFGNTVDIDANIPPLRYYKSGLEMVRMANVYLDEGSLENAFILYMKFMTLFIEKIRTHPEFNTVSAHEKYINSQRLKEVFPKAEKLKSRLLERYTVEYERYLKDEKRKEEAAKAKKHPENSKRGRDNVVAKPPVLPVSPAYAPHIPEPVILAVPEPASKLHITPVPNISCDVLYPSDALNDVEARPHQPLIKPQQPAAKPQHLSVTKPNVNRSTKPTNLLSPTVNLPHSKLRTIVVPGNLIKQFTNLAQRNTERNVETCGILAGQLKRDELVITHLLIPQQTGSSDACDTQREEDLYDYQDQHDLITFGWIHTHPTQTAFLSSVDLHTHCSYQRMMPEAIAIVCAPRYSENKFFYLTPDYGLDYIANCTRKGFHPHPTEPELYTVAGHVKIDTNSSVNLVDLRINKN